jgi:hypothetical protein
LKRESNAMTSKKTSTKVQMPKKTNFGNSILPSHNQDTYKLLEGKYGKLQVRPIEELEEHGLFYLANPDPASPQTVRDWMLVVMHPNGHSCKALAERILQVWRGERRNSFAMDQVQYILDCGGFAQSSKRIGLIIDGKF